MICWSRTFTITCLLVTMASAILLFTLAISGQEMTKEEKRASILKHPTSFKVELARRKPESYDPPGESHRPFKPDENIYFLIEVTSNLPDPIDVQIFNRYYQNRPELFHDGQPVAYREKIAERLALIDANADYERYIETTTLLPATSTEVGIIELRDWHTGNPANSEKEKCTF